MYKPNQSEIYERIMRLWLECSWLEWYSIIENIAIQSLLEDNTKREIYL